MLEWSISALLVFFTFTPEAVGSGIVNAVVVVARGAGVAAEAKTVRGANANVNKSNEQTTVSPITFPCLFRILLISFYDALFFHQCAHYNKAFA
jgi:hypothetical protein